MSLVEFIIPAVCRCVLCTYAFSASYAEHRRQARSTP